MAFASRTYTPGSSTTAFALTNSDGNPIGYIRESDIKVTVNGTVFTNAASGANTYQFTGTSSLEQPSGTTITLNAGVTGTVKLERTTGISSATVTYTAGSTLTSTDLNNADNQIRFGLQEFSDDYAALFTGTGDLTDLGAFIGSGVTWVSNNAKAATTAAIDGQIDAKATAKVKDDIIATAPVSIADDNPSAGKINISVDAELTELATMPLATAEALADLSGTEVQILDGATLTTTELNHVDGVTSAIQTQLDGKQASDADLTAIAGLTATDGNFIVGSPSGWTAESGTTARASLGAQAAAADLTNLSGCQTGASAALALLTEDEVEILDGLTATTAELNVLNSNNSTGLPAIAALAKTDGNIIVGDGTTWVAESGATARTSLGAQAQSSILGTLAGMHTDTASILAGSTALTATLTNLNITDGMTKATSLTASSDTEFPTSKAVNDQILTVTNALGGFVAIANEASFPNANPDPEDNAGTVVSIADVGGLVVNSSGVATNASTVGGTAVTINGIATTFRGTTMTTGVGMQVQTTTTLNTYTYHKAILREQDISSISTDIEDFGNRYRVGSSNPTSDNDAGDLFFNTGTDKMLVRNAANNAWDEVQSIGNFFINTISSAGSAGDTPPGGSATFNGTAQKFTLSNPGSVAEQHIVSINGVIQKPNAGTSTPSEGFSMNGAVITFAAAPPASAPFYIVTIGASVNIGTPSDNTVDTDILQSGAVTNAKVDANAAIAGSKIAPDFGSQTISTTGTTNLGNTFFSGGADGTLGKLTLALGNASTKIATIQGTSSSTNEKGIAFKTFSFTAKDALTLTPDGSVGIGTNSPSTNLHLGASGADQKRSIKIDGTNGSSELQGVILESDGENAKFNIKMGIGGGTPATKLTIDSSGKVGINQTPTRELSLHSPDNNNALIHFTNDDTGETSGDGIVIGLNGNEDLIINNQEASKNIRILNNGERMRIDSSGNMLLGATSYGGGGSDPRLYVVGTSGRQVKIHNTNDDSACLQLTNSGTGEGDDNGAKIAMLSDSSLWIANDEAAEVKIATDGDERIRITQTGKVRINRTTQISSDAHVSIMGNFGSSGCGVEIQHQGNSGSNRDFIRFWNKDDNEAGSIEHSASTSVAFNTSSDYRLKENIALITDGITKLKLLKPSRFTWKDDPEKGSFDGFIAHEVTPACPSAVTGEKDAEKMQKMDYSRLTPLLTAALQEAISKIETLETKVAALESA